MARENQPQPQPPDPLPVGRSDGTTANAAHWILEAAGVAGPSPASLMLADLVTKAAKTPGGILILGEPGCGQWSVARAIHHLSRPAHAPFVSVSCSDEPSRLERSLFGEDRALRRTTDARVPAPEMVTSDAAIFRATGGTLFLDGVEDLPEPIQARLAHLLRDREVLVADQKGRHSLDIRPIGAAGEGIDEEVNAGRVRPDLIHRLSALRIVIPPLRVRRQDIPAITAHWLDAARRKAGLQSLGVDAAAQALLNALPWRGNIKELKAVIEHLVTQSSGRAIAIEDVLALVPVGDTPQPTPTALGRQMTLRDARHEFERHYIAAVMAANHSRIPEAAKALGIQRTNLYRKLRSLKLSVGGRRPAMD